MILRQKSRDKFYSWYWNSNMTEVVAQKSWLSHFIMLYLAFPGWMMTLSKRQDGYLNQQVILFRLQYETNSLQINPKSPCRSVVSLTPKLLEQQYVLGLVIIPCWYLTSMSPFFQTISPSLSSHISYVAVPHLLRHRIHTCCTASPPPWSSTDVFTADIVCRPYDPASPPRLHCYPPASLLRSLSNYIPSLRILRRRCLSTFSNWIFSSLYVFL